MQKHGVEVWNKVEVDSIHSAGNLLTVSGTQGFRKMKLFDVVAARTGLRHAEAGKVGFDPLTAETTVWDHKAYYPGARELHLRVTGDRKTGQLLGAQLLGHADSEVSKRADVFAAALYHGMQVEELNDLDLSYTPPLSSPWDPVQMAAQAWSKARQQETADCGSLLSLVSITDIGLIDDVSNAEQETWWHIRIDSSCGDAPRSCRQLENTSRMLRFLTHRQRQLHRQTRLLNPFHETSNVFTDESRFVVGKCR